MPICVNCSGFPEPKDQVTAVLLSEFLTIVIICCVCDRCRNEEAGEILNGGSPFTETAHAFVHEDVAFSGGHGSYNASALVS